MLGAQRRRSQRGRLTDGRGKGKSRDFRLSKPLPSLRPKRGSPQPSQVDHSIGRGIPFRGGQPGIPCETLISARKRTAARMHFQSKLVNLRHNTSSHEPFY
jgi:hypothetical protein